MRLMKDTQSHDEDGVIKPGAKLSGNAYATAARGPRHPAPRPRQRGARRGRLRRARHRAADS